MTILPGNCPRCGFYKRGQDGTCVNCGARWPEQKNPAGTDMPTGRGPDADGARRRRQSTARLVKDANP